MFALRFFVHIFLFISIFAVLFARDISGIYLTHKDTPGGQTVVEIFKYNDKYYVYGLKNLNDNIYSDSCNIHKELRNRHNVGSVFAYDYAEDEDGEFVGGSIYNFYNCKTYHGKIVPKQYGVIDFVGALDSYYIFKKTYAWTLMTEDEASAYNEYRKPMNELIKSIEDTKNSRK